MAVLVCVIYASLALRKASCDVELQTMLITYCVLYISGGVLLGKFYCSCDCFYITCVLTSLGRRIRHDIPCAHAHVLNVFDRLVSIACMYILDFVLLIF